MAKEKTVKAKKVYEGDFLTGLDDGYVYVEPEPDPDVRYGRHNASAAGEGYVQISFHTAEGHEAFIICPDDMPITVRRP